MPQLEDQWPSSYYPPPDSQINNDDNQRIFLREQIEIWMSKRWGARCFLMPSGRAGIGLVLRYLEVSRNDVIYAPKWSSHCIWDVLGRFGNPSCGNLNDSDVVLAVHKYGQLTSYQTINKVEIIEDLCDALIPEGGSLFPNNGRFAILSLPKIAGMWGGGILAVRSEIDAEKISSIRESIPFDDLSISQGNKKWLAGGGSLNIFDSWSTNEYRNVHPDITLINFVYQFLPNALELNSSKIRSRLNKLTNIEVISSLVNSQMRNGWLPPVLAIPTTTINDVGLVTRQIDLTFDGNNPRYEPCYILPLHFGLDSKSFDRIYKEISSASS